MNPTSALNRRPTRSKDVFAATSSGSKVTPAAPPGTDPGKFANYLVDSLWKVKNRRGLQSGYRGGRR